MSAPEAFDNFGMSRSDAARSLVDRAMAEHFNSAALLHLLQSYMVAHEAGKTALFIAVAERITDRPDFAATGQTNSPGVSNGGVQA